MLVIKEFAFQAVKKKKKQKKKVSNQNLGDSFFLRKLSGLGMAWGGNKVDKIILNAGLLQGGIRSRNDYKTLVTNPITLLV